jgi:hypothetical protein
MQGKHNSGLNYSQHLTLNSQAKYVTIRILHGAADFDKSRGSFHISDDIPQSKFNLLMKVNMQENHKKANYIIQFYTTFVRYLQYCKNETPFTQT